MTLEQLKEEARMELTSKYNFDGVFGVNSEAEKSLKDFIDSLVARAYEEGKKEEKENRRFRIMIT